MPKYHINSNNEIKVCRATQRPCRFSEERHFTEDKVLTLKTSIDSLFKGKTDEPKKEEDSWVQGYRAMLSTYLSDRGSVNDGYRSDWGMLALNVNTVKNQHFRLCPEGNTITDIQEESFTISGWDSFTTPQDVPVTIVEGKANCGCGLVKNTPITVISSIQEILMETLRDNQ